MVGVRANQAHRDERIALVFLMGSSGIFVLAIALILGFLVVNGTKLFYADHVSPIAFLFGTQWDGFGGKYGAAPFIVGSLVATGFAILLGGPLGVAIGLFFSELAPKRVATAFKPAIEVLVGIPSIVYGWIGLTLLVPFLGKVTHSEGNGILAAGLVLSIMILPTVISLSEDALKVVPTALREGSAALGATRWETMSKVLIPAASSGLAVAVILGIARAIGETLAVQLVLGNAPVMPTGLLSSASALTSEIVMEMGDAPDGSPFKHALFSMALLLLLISMGLIVLIRLACESAPDVARALTAIPTVAQPLASGNARSRRIVDKIATAALWTAASAVVALLLLFVVYLFVQGYGAISWHFLTGYPQAATAGGGVGPEIFNSFYILILTLIFTLPISILAGVYLQEYSGPGRFRDIVQFSAESLATVPSIVMALFGLLVFVQILGWHFTALGGALTLTFLNLPAMMRVTQEALASVPATYREASMGLGATKWQTVLRAILPSAIGPLTTGVVLVSGRIFGETAALIFTAGASVSYGASAYDFNPFHTAETLAVHLYSTQREALVPDATQIANGSALVLLVMVLIFNIVARVVGRQLTLRFTGKA